MFEHEPIARVRPARFVEVLAQVDAHEITESDRGEGEDCDRDGKLRRDRSFDGRMIVHCARLLHQQMGQPDHLAPNAVREHGPDQLEVLARQCWPAVILQTGPDLVESRHRALVQSAGGSRNAQELAAEFDGEHVGLGAILLPIRVDHSLDEVGVEEDRQ